MSIEHERYGSLRSHKFTPKTEVHSYNFAYSDKKVRDQKYDQIVTYMCNNPPPFEWAVAEYESLVGARYGWMILIFIKASPYLPSVDNYFCKLVSELTLQPEHCGLDEHLSPDIIQWGRIYPKQT